MESLLSIPCTALPFTVILSVATQVYAELLFEVAQGRELKEAVRAAAKKVRS